MDEETFNMSVRKFLKTLGVTAQREIERAVRERVLDDPADAAHPRVDGRAPRGRQHIDDRRRVRLAQQRDQRLRQDGVADPARRDDEDALAGHVGL